MSAQAESVSLSARATLRRRLARDFEGIGRLASAAPTAVWVAGLVIVSSLVELSFVRGLLAPRIFGDELIYSELARSFAATGHFTVREVASRGYGAVYPALISPAFAGSRSLPHAYSLAKGINAVLMSCAAVPAYLLARRVLGRGRAFVVAALAVAVPSMVYTGSIMTESAFYPLFLLCVLALVLALERPTSLRQLSALGTLGLAFLTRAQAIVLVPAYLCAILLLAVLDVRDEGEPVRLRRLVRRLAAFRISWLVMGAGAALVLAVQLARGRSPSGLLGAYHVVAGQASITAVPRWFLYHVADLDLYLGIVPFAAFLLFVPLTLRRRGQSRPLRVVAVASLSITAWMVLSAAVLSSSVWGLGGLHERNVFYVAPLFVMVMLAWIDRGMPRPRVRTALALCAAGGLPALLPYKTAVGSASFDALAVAPWSVVPIFLLPIATAIFGLGLASLLLLRRPGPILVVAVFATFYITTVAAGSFANDNSSRAAVGVHRDWIDRAVGPDSRVAAVWLPSTSVCAPKRQWGRRWSVVWESEFFNRSVRGEYYLGRPTPDNLPATRLAAMHGRFVPTGQALHAQYVFADHRVRLSLPIVARDARNHSILYRLSRPFRIRVAGDCAAAAGLLSGG